ncbi:hypothetical protein DBR11_14720 [Pedobacter sp. HMWF019]|uniref:hypothetical protein n=1 Tax=Pedobacter sp. HMWF019 TaxID=2056856 RepID=UPI000D382246|nr:hypothetical protein [Pedobacter sp. HMWF019]PTS98497.1 hypothetical protein DBR11_14720 [Pedobacter sp. HMWF019]
MINSALSTGTTYGWVCITSGTPGVWLPVGILSKDADKRNSGPTINRPVVTTIGFQYFDTTLGCAVWWNGSTWISGNSKRGVFITSGAGQSTITIPHGLSAIPTFTSVIAKSADAISAKVISWTENATQIVITVGTTAIGTNNLSYSWEASL